MKYLFMALVRLYRRFISPLKSARCKYYPTCSRYALDALDKFGAIGGSALAVWRILRCNPWSKGGIDPVPEKFTFKVKKFDYSVLGGKPLSEVLSEENEKKTTE